MGAALEDYRKRFCERQAKAASDAENRAIRADLLTELQQRHDEQQHLGGSLEKWRNGPNWEAIRAAWQQAVSHFSEGLDATTGEVRPMPKLTLCDGTIVIDLYQSQCGLARAEAELQRITETHAALDADPAANRRVAVDRGRAGRGGRRRRIGPLLMKEKTHAQ